MEFGYGALPQIPLHFFVLIQKNEAKKIKTAPASLEKVAM